MLATSRVAMTPPPRGSRSSKLDWLRGVPSSIKRRPGAKPEAALIEAGNYKCKNYRRDPTPSAKLSGQSHHSSLGIRRDAAAHLALSPPPEPRSALPSGVSQRIPSSAPSLLPRWVSSECSQSAVARANSVEATRSSRRGPVRPTR